MGELENNNLGEEGVLVCRGCVKLWIVDVLNIPSHPTSPNVYVFQDLNLNKVDVCGVVTDCQLSGTRTIFTIDDTTGSIECRLNYNCFASIDAERIEFEKTLESIKTTGADTHLSEALSNLLLGAKKRGPFQGKFKVGDAVQVSGFISECFEGRTINVFDVSDPLTRSSEISRMCSMVVLYNEVYGMSGRNQETESSATQEYECLFSHSVEENFIWDSSMKEDSPRPRITEENPQKAPMEVDLAHEPTTEDDIKLKASVR